RSAPDGSFFFAVSAGQTGPFTVTLPTFDNGRQEGDKQFELTAVLSGATANGSPLPEGIQAIRGATIVDNDVLDVTVQGGGLVTEGQPANFIVDLGGTVDADVTVTVTINHIDTVATDFWFDPDVGVVTRPDGTPIGAVVDAANGSFSFMVAKDERGPFNISVPTIDDGLHEGSQRFELVVNVSGETAGGTPVRGNLAATGTA